MRSVDVSEASLRARIRQQEVVADLGQQALETDDLDQLMHDAAEAVAGTLGCEYAKVLELLPEGDAMLLRQGVGWQEGLVGEATVPTALESQAGYTLVNEGPVVVDDMQTEVQFSGPDLLRDHDVRSGISVVIGSVDEPWGVLGVHTVQKREFSQHDATFVQSVANVLASAIESHDATNQLEEIYGRISDAFFALDEEWEFTHINEQAHELINPESRTLLGTSIWDEFPAATERKFKPKYERAMYEQETVAFEEYYPEPLDTWFEVRAYPSETGLSVYFKDITERKARERALTRTKRRFEAIFEDPNILVGLLDTDGTVLDINETAMEYIDADLEAVRGEPFWETPWWGEGDDVPERVREWTNRAAAGEYVDFEADLTRPDGEQYTLNGVFRPVTNEDGEVVSVIVSDRDITERRAYERRLEQSEQRYRTLAESFPNGLVTLYDEDLRYTVAEGQAFEYLPVSGDDIEGDTPTEAWGEEAGEAFEPLLRGALWGHEGVDEVTYANREWRVYAVPITDSDGEVFAGMTMAQDITEQVERERRLEESERLYRTLAQNFPNGAVGVYDDDLRYDLVEGAMWDTMEPDAADLEGNTVSEAFSPGFVEDIEPVFRAAIEDGDIGSVETEYYGRVLRVWAAPLRDTDGEIFAGLSFAQDITEHVERERELEESKNQLEALIDVLPVAVFVAEADGEIVEWNEAAVDIWGGEVAASDSVTEYDEYNGWWVDSGERVQPEEWPLARALDGEEVTDPDPIEIEGFDGERRTVLNHGTPVRDSDGEVIRAVVTLTDITERREYQRRLEESNERLEQFAYAASHDLQEPLRMVSSYLQLIDERYSDELDEDAEEFLEFAVDGADRMREMIDALLDYSRVETRGDPLELVDLNDLLDDVRADLQKQIEETGAEVTVEALPEVLGDPNQLRQLFQNLLDNALTYAGDEPPRIHVSAERAGELWELSVRDEGIGIDPENEEEVFEVFQRLHSREEYEGTGIGLALCERIVERHGGTISVESEPGEGSTFRITLPAADK